MILGKVYRRVWYDIKSENSKTWISSWTSNPVLMTSLDRIGLSEKRFYWISSVIEHLISKIMKKNF